MHITMNLENGFLPDEYGKYADPADCYGWSCRRSFPFEVTDIPAETKALAFVFLDWTAFLYAVFRGFIGALMQTARSTASLLWTMTPAATAPKV